MATRRPVAPTIASGRRGYLRYQYGDHYWVPEIQAGWSRGMFRDVARDAIPPGGIYDAVDYLLHQPGLAQKRGGTTTEGTLGAGTYVQAVKFCEFPAGAKIVAINNLGALYSKTPAVLPAAMTALGGATVSTIDKPKFRVGSAKTLLVIANSDGTSGPTKWDGTAAPAALGGTPPAGKYAELYKSRLALAGSGANPNRIYFSPTPDIEATWDTANAWIDCDYTITGMAALQNTLLVFSASHFERIIGATPPPNTDMDRAVVAAQGCVDARSLIVYGGLCYFANQNGVYRTNGTEPQSLTDRGGIGSYWRSLMTTVPSARLVSMEAYRDFLFVSIYLGSNGTPVDSLICYLPTFAWARLSNVTGTMWTVSGGDQNDLYYADRGSATVVRCNGFFSPLGTNKADFNSVAVQPTIEFAPSGAGPGVKSFGFGHLNFDMRDAAADNPTMAVTIKAGMEADTSSTPAESPLVETTTLARPRFTIAKEAQAVTVALAQSGPSAKTELYALEVETRPQPMTGEGVS